MSQPKHCITIYLSVDDYNKAEGMIAGLNLKSMSALVKYFLDKHNSD